MTISADLAIYSKSICSDIEHGASHIMKMATGSLRTAIIKNPSATPGEVIAATREYALRLMNTHRRIAPILNFCNRILLELDKASKDDTDIRERLCKYALDVSEASSKSMEEIASQSARVISGNSFLAHSRSSTLLSFLLHIRDREGLIIYVTQSRPGGEGRLLAGELSVAGIPTVLMEDSEAMRYLYNSSALLIGTDAIIPSGIVNKVGTHMISLAAREMGIPVYCLTESMKIWPFDQPILEGLSKKYQAPLGGMEFFELVPGYLFKRIILETGPTTFEDIVLSTENFEIAPEVSRFAQL